MPLPSSISFDGIAAFVHTVDAGSFSAASERMGLSKSAAAKNVARLEARLGVQLLLRTTRSVTLTPDGEIFLQRCRAILEDVAAAEALMSVRRREVSGTLRVSLPSTFGRLWAAPVLMEMAAAHPGLVLDLSFTDRFVDLIDEGIDIAVRIGPSEDRANVMTRKLADQNSILCAAPQYLARFGTPTRLDDLADHRCLLFARGHHRTPWRLCGEDGETVDHLPEAHMLVGHGEALLDAACAGHGLARLATWLAGHQLQSGALVAVMPFADFTDQTIHALWPRRRDHAPKVRCAIDALVGRFHPHPPWLPTRGSPAPL